MTLAQIFTWSGGGVLLLLTLLQISPIKVDPWSSLARWIGRAVNGDVLRELDHLESRLSQHIDTDDKRDADSHRQKILRFNNELLRAIDHTKEEFVEILTEIDAYERYCQEHPDYPNNRAVLAVEYIRENYKKRLQKHDFLQEG